MRRGGAALALLLLALASAPAAGGTLTITYEITGGSILAPSGTVTGGLYTLRLPADGPATPGSGPATVASFSLRGSDQFTTLGNVIDTHFSLVLTGPVTGNATAGSGFRNAGVAVLTGPAYVHCSGPDCAGAGFPPSVTHASPLRVTAFGSGASLYPGGGRVSGTYRLMTTTDFFSVSFTGREIARSFVPEAGARGWALVSALGVATLYAGSRRGRHRTVPSGIAPPSPSP